MQVIHLTDNNVTSIIEKLSADENVIQLLNQCIETYSESKVRFLYDLICENVDLYQPLFDPHTYIGHVNPNDIVEQLSRLHRHIDKRNIYVANKLDILHGVYWQSATGLRVNNQTYDEIHWRIEEISGIHTAMTQAAEVYACIECLMTYVESMMLKDIMINDDGAYDSVFFYVQMLKGRLVLTVV